MNRCQTTLAFAAIALLAPLTAQAIDARIQGRVDFSHARSSPSGDVQQGDTLDFNQAMTPNAVVNFALAAQSSDAVGASVVASVGSGWMRFHGTAYSALQAAPLHTEVGGSGRFTIYATVADVITIDAPGLTGTAGSASLGFLVDGVVSAAVQASYPRSDGDAEGLAILSVGFANWTTSDWLRADVGYPDWMQLPPAMGFSDQFLGGVVNFTYGTPFDMAIVFYSEGRARARSDEDGDVGGLPGVATLVSDFGNTLTWAGVSDLRDAGGNLVTDFAAVSGSGADFRYAITAPPVPEPATVLLWAAGLAGLTLGVRRRQRPASISA